MLLTQSCEVSGYLMFHNDAQTWTALFQAISSHQQPSACLTKGSRSDFPGVDHEGRQACSVTQ